MGKKRYHMDRKVGHSKIHAIVFAEPKRGKSVCYFAPEQEISTNTIYRLLL